MRNWYSGAQAKRYQRRWGTFTKRSLATTLATLDWQALQRVPERLGRAPHVLDVGCGTGFLLRRLLERVPELRACGLDASADMLAQARLTLRAWPNVELLHVRVGMGEPNELPYAPGTFDVITCTNVLHYLPQPEATLAALRQLLAPEGQLILEDYARRSPPFPWPVFEGLIRCLDAQHLRAYTLSEAHALTLRAKLPITAEYAFSITWLWHGWIIRAQG
ncbi:MAG TPA: methyltransferase [Ktedonobacterales bacterium]|nr:methyltransferase [Ktedonobacterales bacterium]